MNSKTIAKKQPELKPRAVKISGDSYELVVAEALRTGVKQGRMVNLQEVLDTLIKEKLSGKPKPELKE